MLQRSLGDLPVGFLRNLKWQYAANLGAGGLAGLYMFLLGRVLGVSEFGVYALCVSFATLIFNLSDMRLHEATIRFVSLSSTDDSIEAAESALTVTALILLDIVAKVAAFAVLMMLLGWAGRYLVKTPDTQLLLVLAGISLFVSKAGNAPAVGILRVTDKFDIHAWVTLMDWGGRLVITALVTVVTPLTVGLALAVLIIVGAAANVGVLLLARKSWLAKYGRCPTPLAGKIPAKWRQVRHFVLFSNGISISSNVVKEMDTMIVGWFLSIETVAIYRMAKQITQMLWRAGDPVFFVIMPELTKFLVGGDTGRLKAFLKRVTALLFAAALVIYLSAALCVPWIVKQFLGAEFAPITAIFPVMSSWILVCLPLIWTHALAAAAGRPDVQLRADIISNALAALLLVCGTWFWGLNGAVIGSSAGLTATFVISFFFIWKSRLYDKP